MSDFEKNVGVGAETEILISYPNELDSANVRCTIYRISDSYYWNPSTSTFTSSLTYLTLTRTVGKTWRGVYTPATAVTHIVSIEVEGTLRDYQYHYGQGGVVQAAGGTGYTRAQLIGLWEAITHDDSYVDDHKASIVNMLNMAINDICRENNGDWRFLEDDSTIAMVASQITPYSFGSTVNEVINMRIISPEKKLIHFPGGWQNFIRHYPKHTGTGSPTWYIPYGVDSSGYKQVYFYPWPSTAITIYYEFYKTMGLLNADSDIPDIPQQYQILIALRAAWYHVLTKNKTMSQLLEVQYRKGISDLISWNGNFIDTVAEIPYNDMGAGAGGESEPTYTLS